MILCVSAFLPRIGATLVIVVVLSVWAYVYRNTTRTCARFYKVKDTEWNLPPPPPESLADFSSDSDESKNCTLGKVGMRSPILPPRGYATDYTQDFRLLNRTRSSTHV